MQIQVFNAQDMASALLAVKRQMGPDALILRQRNIWGRNHLGIKGLQGVEVTAANLDAGESLEALRELGFLDGQQMERLTGRTEARQGRSLVGSDGAGAAGGLGGPSRLASPDWSGRSDRADRLEAPEQSDPSDGSEAGAGGLGRFAMRKWGRSAYLREQMAAPPLPDRPVDRPAAPQAGQAPIFSYDFPEAAAPPRNGGAPHGGALPQHGAGAHSGARPSGLERLMRHSSGAVTPGGAPTGEAPDPSLPEPRSATIALRTEINSLRSELASVRKGLLDGGAAPEALDGAAGGGTGSAQPGRRRLTRLERASELLGSLGLEAEYAHELVSDWFCAEDARLPGARAEVEGPVRAGIRALCRCDADLSNTGREGPRVIALVGGTGVGKTTTIAKIAAREVLESGRRVALLTCDNYRIAAVEQLRMYARIIGVPMKVTRSAEEMKSALRIYGDYGLILIDTPGLPPRMDDAFAELQTILSSSDRIEKYLTVSATTKTEEMIDLWRAYEGMGLDRLVFCKIDESIRYGCLLPMLKRSRIPVAFLTNGQRVPEDLERAESEGLYRLFDRV